MKIVFLTDFSKDEYKGGTEYYADFLNRAAAERYEFDSKLMTSKTLNERDINEADFVVMLNIGKIPEKFIRYVMKTKPYTKIEMDYGFCEQRNGMCGSNNCGKLEDGKCFAYNFPFYREVLEGAQFITFLNPHQREFYRTHFGDLVNNSIICMSFYGYPEEFKDEGRFRLPNSFFFAARMYEEKGVMNVIRLAIENPQANFYFLGFGDPRLIAAIHNVNNCVYLGDLPIDRTEMAHYYNMFENFVSLPNWEDTGPIKVVEAELCGMQLIANDNNKIRTNGWKDAKDLVTHINGARDRLFKKIKNGIPTTKSSK